MHHFEVGTVAFFSSDRFNLKNLFIVANILTYYTRGRNIIFGWHVYAFRMTSSDPISPIELKAPYEYIAIARLLWFAYGQGLCSCNSECDRCDRSWRFGLDSAIRDRKTSI